MSDLYQVITPENVEIDYELAGIGSRFLALMIDTCIQTVFSIGLFFSLQLLGFDNLGLHTQISEWIRSIAATIILTFFGIVWLGYYVILEAAFNGQTFGKRLLNIRVRKEMGYAPTFWDILLRNMIRPIDFLPSFYAIGFLSMFLSSKSKRLGDFAAGTIVVKEIPRKKIKNFLNTPEKAFSPDVNPDSHTSSLLLQVTQADYFLLQDLYNRRTQLTNYNVLAANLLERIFPTGLPDEIGPISPTNAPDILEQLLQQYEQTYYSH